MLILLGVAVVIVGFAVRLNPLLVVVAAAVVTGMLAGIAPLALVAMLGKAFNDNRLVSAAFLVLPLVGVLERAGIREHAGRLITRLRGLSVGRLLIGYMALREITTAFGLVSIAGQAQTIRPIVAPMAESAIEAEGVELDDETRHAVRAMSAATDNVAVFFSEDIFVAIGSVLLIVSFLASNGIVMDAIRISLWAIPTAICAFAVHATRLLLFDRRLRRRGKP
ncbi:MAG: DUF969 domain-containing protein [Phenylobacterium sp.]